MGISVKPEDLNDPAYLRGLEAGQKIAEERIIKLLWANVRTTTSPIDGTVHQSLRISPKDFEALIKGEKHTENGMKSAGENK